jgi:DNA polymerase I-like protein with 3'-5' exonuclease and polymerase domains
VVRTEKAHASFNNYIQSSASEIVVDKVFEMRELLKSKQSQFLFQVHDSLVFDIHPSEKSLIKDIGNVLSKHKNMNFTLAYKFGENYKNLSQNIAFSS